MEGFRCKERFVEMMLTESMLLKYANECLEERNVKEVSNLISASELNINARKCVEEGFKMLKDKIASEVGHYYVDDSDNEVGSSKIKDPVGRHAKAEHSSISVVPCGIPNTMFASTSSMFISAKFYEKKCILNNA
ncbi:hypothetical protein M9H77_11413 [Catharanthus roseus]|uniref:Uncharacterized protein n=1 Tax=Catharanthus roseus TaxID=4058 RepID=A0ACC0BEK1_CATRO|nr:hypothetical protein M9H77_11413 [Catharanthus roseus]